MASGLAVNQHVLVSIVHIHVVEVAYSFVYIIVLMNICFVYAVSCFTLAIYCCLLYMIVDVVHHEELGRHRGRKTKVKSSLCGSDYESK